MKMLTRDDILPEIGWKNRDRILGGLLSLSLESLALDRSVKAGFVGGNDYHQELADSAACWLRTQGRTWATEQWHAGYRCDLVADDVIVEVGNTDPDRALGHLRQTDGRFCVVPYQDGEPLTMLIFRRGSEWEAAKVDDLLLVEDKHSKNILDRLGVE